MPAEPEVTLDQVRDILEMLRRTIQGASELAIRVETLEKASHRFLDIVAKLQDHQERLMSGIDRHSELQNKLNHDMSEAISQMLARLDYLEGRKQVM